MGFLLYLDSDNYHSAINKRKIKNMHFKKSTLVLLISLLSISSSFSQMTILSGPRQGSYYFYVKDMVDVLNTDTNKTFANKETPGASYNFEELLDPETPYKVALVQSDLLYYMQLMDSKNNTNYTDDIKVLMPLTNEEIHVVTKTSSGLKKLEDLKGKNVGVGTKEQGTYASAIMMKERSLVFWNTKIGHFDQALYELYGDKIDAFIVVGSAPLDKLNLNPQAMVDELTLVPLTNVNDWAKYLSPDVIYASDYKWLDEDIPTYSVKSLLVVNEAKLTTDDKVELEKLVNGLKSKFDYLKTNGSADWNKVDFNSWDASNWPVYKF
jgi:TRAP transporter TAXI family solute receptor